MPTEKKWVKTESVYDIAKVTRALMDWYPLATPPRVHPRQLLPLIELLEKVTTLAERHADKVQRWLSERGGFVDLWLQYTPAKRELEAWRLRLINYRASVETCLEQDDAECTLWTVTAPLFYGFFGGATSKAPKQPADVLTPFKIANTLGAIVEADETSNIDALLEELYGSTKDVVVVIKDTTIGTVRALGEAAGAAAGAAAGGIKAGLASDAGGWALMAAGLFAAWYFLIRKPKEALT